MEIESQPPPEKKTRVLGWGDFLEELKRMSSIAAPMMAVSMILNLLQVVSMMMAGHLSELSLSGVSTATAFTNVTGFSLLVGLCGGLETICGQAFGAEQYKKFGSYTYCAVMCLVLFCLPVSVLWIFLRRLLIAIGINSDIAVVAGHYAIWLIPSLFAFAILQVQIRYFQFQSLIHPILISTSASLCFHIPSCWALVYKRDLGIVGAALAIGVSYWLNVILLAVYMFFSSSCEKTRSLYWDDIFSSTIKLFRFALPSAVMVCLEWWTYEIVVMLSGLLPDPKLQTSVLAIGLTITSLHFYLQYGIGAAGSTRISNELGAGNPREARVAARVALIISLVEAVTASIILFLCRHILGHAFSSEKAVVDYVAELVPFMCLSIIIESLGAVLCGISRGCGLQKIGVYINLGAYYTVAIPVAVLLCFMLHLKIKGLWMGLLSGKIVQATFFAVVTALTNWKRQAVKARERSFDG